MVDPFILGPAPAPSSKVDAGLSTTCSTLAGPYIPIMGAQKVRRESQQGFARGSARSTGLKFALKSPPQTAITPKPITEKEPSTGISR